MPGEELLYEGTPERSKLSMLYLLSSLLICIFFFPLFLLFPLFWWMAHTRAKRHSYVLTNQRVVVTHGLLGYRTRSVPLERVSDVTVSCTFFHRLLGIRTIVVRDMTGEMHAGAGASLEGLLDPSELQALILGEVRRVNFQESTAGGTLTPSLPAGVGDAGKAVEQRRQLIDLLEGISTKLEASAS